VKALLAAMAVAQTVAQNVPAREERRRSL
jgi:hypothetical protein